MTLRPGRGYSNFPDLSAESTELGEPLHDHGHALAAADAHGLHAELLVVGGQVVQQGGGDPGAGHTERVAQGDVAFNQVELEILGFDHAMVGSRVAEKWRLPEQLVEAIALHHNPQQAAINPQLTAITHIADAVCVAMGIGIGVDGMLYPISGQAMEMLGLDEISIEKTISELTDVFCDQQVFNLG